MGNLCNQKIEPSREIYFTRQANKSKYADNSVSTTKYNIITFLPLALIIQFIRPANWVYLITAVLQAIPEISSLSPVTAIAPLIFVLGVALIKEAIEDIKRYLKDRQTNNSETQYLQNGQWIKARWQDIQVGDFIKIKDNQIIPADLILLYSTEENSICYVQTSNLDGQSNLKTKTAHVEDIRIFPQQFQKLRGQIQVEGPNRNLHQFNATMKIFAEANSSGQNRRISLQNLLVRGSMLRNTQYAVGVVIYTGHDTKIMRNQGSMQHKVSHVEIRVNKIQGFLLFALTMISIGCAIGYYNYHTQYANGARADFFYLRTSIVRDMRYQSLLIFFTAFLLLSFIIPVSMNVALQGIKIFQGFFIGWDKKMYYKPLKQYCNALNLSIIEQLGLVDYVLTDKTGTLTANQMKFQYVFIEGQKYSAVQLREIFDNDKKVEFGAQFLEFWLAVIICHDVVVDTKNNQYQGSSPDEVCFVEYASKIGYKFIKKTKNSIQLEVNNKKAVYQYVHMIPFSPRKRMSVIVKDVNSGKYWLYTKGADSAILNKAVQKNSKTPFKEYQQQLINFSTLGYRTLVFSKREIDKSQMKRFLEDIDGVKHAKLKGAISTVQKHKLSQQVNLDSIQIVQSKNFGKNKQKIIPSNQLEEETIEVQKLMEALTERIESGLQVLGVSAIEDRLQDNVPETIARLQEAGIVIMMITGDKLETAQNIGYLSNFIRKNATVFRLRSGTQNIGQQVQLLLDNIQRNQIKDFSVIIEADTIQKFLNFSEDKPNDRSQLQKQLSQDKKVTAKLLLKCNSVIFCRSTPKQKAQIVKFVKKQLQGIVLAIGDGGNDIGMIQQANIGVGLIGKQGNQAASVSDFYFAQFKYLDRLVMHHGRWAYYRMSYFFVYYGWKNLTMTMILFYFLCYSAFSGLAAMSQAFITVFNTAVALILVTYYTVLEQDINQDNYPQCFKKLPTFYKDFKEMNFFSYKRYIVWSIMGILLSLLIHFVFVLSLGSSILVNQDGNPGDYFTYASGAALSLSASVIFVIIADMNNYTWFSFWIVLILLTFLPPIGFFIIQNFMQLGVVSLYYSLTDNCNMRYFAVNWLILSITILIKFGYNQVMFIFWPNSVEIAMHQRTKKAAGQSGQDVIIHSKSSSQKQKRRTGQIESQQMKKIRQEGNLSSTMERLDGKKSSQINLKSSALPKISRRLV